MKTKYRMLMIVLWAFLSSGCVLTQFAGGSESSAGDGQTINDDGDNQGSVGNQSKSGNQGRSGERDVLASLTQTQKLTLLALLESYDSNQEAIEAWKASQASVARLVELEKDLKFLILQLDSLNQQAQEAKSPPDKSIKATTNEGANTSVVANELENSQRGNHQNKNNQNKNNQNDTNQTENDRQFSSPMMAGFTVQLTAVNSMKHLRTYWQKVKASNPVMFSEASPFYESITDNKGNNMFRLKVGKFDTKPDAMRFCREFVASGGSCYATDNLKGTLLN